MAKLDSAKEEIGWLRVAFALLVAMDASLLAWISQTYGKASDALISMAIAAVTLLTALLVWINRKAYRRIRELGNI